VPIDREKIRSGLLKKGFIEGGGDHDFYYLEIDNKKSSIFTKLSRGKNYKVYSDDLVGSMCGQLGITKKELKALIECPLSYSKYIEILKERGKIRIR
jgi:hypothetical protein